MSQQLLPPGHEKIAEILSYMPGQSIRYVQRKGSLQIGQCYNNVHFQVQKFGGNAVLGWMLTYWPDRFIELIHHAVWKRPSGDLIDPTCALNEVGFVPFIAVSEGQVEPGNNPTVPSQFLILDKSEAVEDYCRLTREVMIARGERDQLLRSHLSAVLGGGRNASMLSPALQARLSEINDRLEQYRAWKAFYAQRFANGNFSNLTEAEKRGEISPLA